jgi:hypothetical protein
LAHNIQEDTSALRGDATRILDEIANLRADLGVAVTPGRAADDDTGLTHGPSYIINRYLDSLTEYAETVVDDASVYNRVELPTIQGSSYPDEQEDYRQLGDPTRNYPPPMPARATFATGIAKTANGDSKLVALSPEGFFVAVQDCPVYREGIQRRILGCWEVTVYEARSGLVAYKHDCRNEIAKALVFSNNSELFALLTDRKARIFNTREWKVAWETDLDDDPVSLCFSNNRTTVAISVATSGQDFSFGRVLINELQTSPKVSMRLIGKHKLEKLPGQPYSLAPELKLTAGLGPITVFNTATLFNTGNNDGRDARVNVRCRFDTWERFSPTPLPSGHRLVDCKGQVAVYKRHTNGLLECFDVSSKWEKLLEGYTRLPRSICTFNFPYPDDNGTQPSSVLFDIKVVGSHHLALYARYSEERSEICIEVSKLIAVNTVGKQAATSCVFRLTRQGPRYISLEEGIISKDGRTLLLKFKVRYLGREKVSIEHRVRSAQGKEIEPGSAIEVWPLSPVD